MREWYHFHACVFSRGRNQSAVAAAAYRAGVRLHSRADGQAKDFSRRQRDSEIAHAEIMAPEGAPEWVYDREELWNRVEEAEIRKDAQLAREVRFALARELSPEDRIEAVRGFIQEEFTSEGMVADFAIHHDRNNHNPHAHIMLTTRELEAEGFGRKAREWNNKARLKAWREGCARSQNRILERDRHEARADHRSYKDRNIDLEPGFHVGPKGWNAGKRLREERREQAFHRAEPWSGRRNAFRPHRGDYEPFPKPAGKSIAEALFKPSNRARRRDKGIERGQTVERGVMWGGDRARNGRVRSYSPNEGLRFEAQRQRKAERLKRAREMAREKQNRDRFDRMFANPREARARFTRYAAEKGMRAAFFRLNREPNKFGRLARERLRDTGPGRHSLMRQPAAPSRGLMRPRDRDRDRSRDYDRDR